MIRVIGAVVLALLSASASSEESKISSLAIGIYQPGEKAMVAPAFINAVNGYLARYEPRLLERSATYVKMTVDYDFDYAVVLRVNDDDYEVTVTLDQKTSRHSKAQKQAAKLVSGVHKTMERNLSRNARKRPSAEN
ncbi:MAG TPA: hypothetical protein VFS77_08885 [Pyrinomonadaceae bacterium]|nr:hypothetical protein [Pyrinomonadaceae bacterium]